MIKSAWYIIISSVFAISANAAIPVLNSEKRPSMPPPGLSGAIPSCVGDIGVNFIEINDDNKSFYRDNVIVESEFLKIGVDQGYFNLIDRVRYIPGAFPIKNDRLIDGIKTIWQINESKNRITKIFTLDGKQMMLTSWNAYADGARICVPKDFLNTRFRSNPGILSLAMALPNTTQCMWKYTWFSNENKNQNEFYLSDECDGGNPKTSKNTMLKILEGVLEFEHD